MSERYFDLTFTPSVKAAQEDNGSRTAYAKLEGHRDGPDPLTEREAAFIQLRDSFYMATVNETGWPYLQHRGGPVGFVKVLGPTTLGIADFRGNRQYISLGNMAKDDRTALFFMDYPNRARLKVMARTRAVNLADHPDLAQALIDDDYGAKVERGFLFEVEAYDWNCSQHITPRLTEADLDALLTRFKNRIADLEAENKRLKEAADG